MKHEAERQTESSRDHGCTAAIQQHDYEPAPQIDQGIYLTLVNQTGENRWKGRHNFKPEIFIKLVSETITISKGIKNKETNKQKQNKTKNKT